MRVFNVANVKKGNDFYEIVSLTTNERKYLENGEDFINITSDATIAVNEAFKNNKRVFIQGEVVFEITEDNLAFKDVDGFEEKQLTLLHKARNVVTIAASTLRGFDFFEFTLCNNFLASKGFFITDDNREEVYIGIINSGDDKTIEQLERYLNALDKISIPYYQYDAFLEFEDGVLNAKSIAELEDLEKNYSYF